MIAHKWERITPLDPNLSYDFAELDSLQQQWTNFRQVREEASPDAYSGFLDRLTRSWAIETGIIEGLYTLDRGVTETLVIRGISTDLIEQGSTNKEPQELVRMLRDHQDAAEGVRLEIMEGRPLSRSAIRQIHSTLTRSQPTYEAVDQFGRRFNTTLEHGQFKTLPNNPLGSTGLSMNTALQSTWIASWTTFWHGMTSTNERLPSHPRRRVAASLFYTDSPIPGW